MAFCNCPPGGGQDKKFADHRKAELGSEPPLGYFEVVYYGIFPFRLASTGLLDGDRQGRTSKFHIADTSGFDSRPSFAWPCRQRYRPRQSWLSRPQGKGLQAFDQRFFRIGKNLTKACNQGAGQLVYGDRRHQAPGHAPVIEALREKFPKI